MNFPENNWIATDGDPWTRAAFIIKTMHEGGLEGMVEWGGPGVFPPSLRDLATKVAELQAKYGKLDPRPQSEPKVFTVLDEG